MCQFSIRRLIKWVPGFRSGKWWKSVIAVPVYLFSLLVILAIVIPSPPSLALEEIKPTNKKTVSLAGKTYSGKPVYLLQNNQIIQSTKADSEGKFFFGLNDLKEGNFTFTVEACNSQKRDHCKSENILLTVDQTPPPSPSIALPENLPEKDEDQIIITGLTEPKAKIIAKLGGQELPSVTADEKGGFEIKGNLTTGTNILSVKSVDEVGNESQPTLTEISFTPKKQKARVIQVVDGDTIKIEGGERVRYIGIDTPETVDPNQPIGCYGKGASDKNKNLVEGKIVYLEKDVSERDKYDRLLRYIWLDDLLVNEYLISEGYARVSTYPPDVKYQDRFLKAERKAREEKKGLWGEICDNWLTEPTPTVTQIKNIPTKTVPPPIY